MDRSTERYWTGKAHRKDNIGDEDPGISRLRAAGYVSSKGTILEKYHSLSEVTNYVQGIHDKFPASFEEAKPEFLDALKERLSTITESDHHVDIYRAKLLYAQINQDATSDVFGDPMLAPLRYGARLLAGETDGGDASNNLLWSFKEDERMKIIEDYLAALKRPDMFFHQIDKPMLKHLSDRFDQVGYPALHQKIKEALNSEELGIPAIGATGSLLSGLTTNLNLNLNISSTLTPEEQAALTEVSKPIPPSRTAVPNNTHAGKDLNNPNDSQKKSIGPLKKDPFFQN